MKSAEPDEREIERIVERILKRRPDLLARALATKGDLKLVVELINQRFQATDKRFEDLIKYVNARSATLTWLILAFNIPILVGIIGLLIRAFPISG